VHGNGDRLCVPICRNSVAKVIANRALCAPTASKGLAYFFNTLRGVQDPSPGLPGREVAQVLGVAAGQLGDPVAVLVLMESADGHGRQSIPSVRVLFAFGQILV